jgi:hypothetical protein
LFLFFSAQDACSSEMSEPFLKSFLGGSLGWFCNSTACNFFSLKMLTASLLLEFGRETRDFRHEIH